jgi:hypothetical protein
MKEGTLAISPAFFIRMEKAPMKLFYMIIFSILLLVVATPAMALELWTLDGVIFSDGATASGSFVLSPDGSIDAVDISTSAGTMKSLFGAMYEPYPGATYNSFAYSEEGGGSDPDGLPLSLYEFDYSHPANSPYAYYQLRLYTYVPLSFAQGQGSYSIPLFIGTSPNYAPAGLYDESVENADALPYRLITAGYLIGTPFATPEPTSIFLLGSGVAWQLVWRRMMLKRV